MPRRPDPLRDHTVGSASAHALYNAELGEDNISMSGTDLDIAVSPRWF